MRGFDFGLRQRVILLSESDIEFDGALRDADVVGCAYGSDWVEGHPSPVRSLTILGRNAASFRRAFAVFDKWGCTVDGDVVDVAIVLQNDGTYILAIGPNMDRVLYRLMPDYQLFEPMLMCHHYVKPMDSTNPALREWSSARYSRFSPISISAAVIKNSLSPLSPENLELVQGLPRFIKFRVDFVLGADAATHWLARARSTKDALRRPLVREPPQLSPDSISSARRQVLDFAFPVSRERILRAKILDGVRSIEPFSCATQPQILQAAINLAVDRELPQNSHSVPVSLKEYEAAKWQHIRDRVERADGKDQYLDMPVGEIAAQISRDSAHLLVRRGYSISRLDANSIQKLFLRKGFGGG